ncbi:MAG: GNAT family N-acetyltransferase [Candidatus Moduliflexus flocculans]|nr:GNAT family N-acetyltransferase [Candidatus Moduliflexus flocculans]
MTIEGTSGSPPITTGSWSSGPKAACRSSPKGRDSLENIVRQIGLAERPLPRRRGRGEGRVVGTVLATHDGRKGWINRVAVDATLRKKGLGARLVRRGRTTGSSPRGWTSWPASSRTTMPSRWPFSKSLATRSTRRSSISPSASIPASELYTLYFSP